MKQVGYDCSSTQASTHTTSKSTKRKQPSAASAAAAPAAEVTCLVHMYDMYLFTKVQQQPTRRSTRIAKAPVEFVELQNYATAGPAAAPKTVRGNTPRHA